MATFVRRVHAKLMLKVRKIGVNIVRNLADRYGVPPWLNEQTEYLLPSSWLGSATSGTSPSQNRIIRNLFEEYANAWSSGSISLPVKSEVFHVDEGRLKSLQKNSISIGFVGTRYYVNEVPLTIDYGGFPGFAESARHSGFQVSEFDVSQTLSVNGYAGRRVTSQQIANRELHRLREHLRDVKPNIVAVDGNFVPGSGCYDTEFLADLKKELGFSLCTFIADFHELQPEDKLGYWGAVSDVVVFTAASWSRGNKYFDRFPRKESILASPCPPADETVWSRSTLVKDIDLGFWGGKGRRRTSYLDFASRCGVETSTVYREEVGRKPMEEYVDFLLRTKISFTSGFTGIAAGRRTGIMTYRIWESILARSLLIHESGCQIDDYLSPFIHYVPVDNVHELVHYSRYLLANEETSERISTAAYSFYMRNYSSTKFWNRLRDMINR